MQEHSYIIQLVFRKGGYRNRKVWKFQENKFFKFKYMGKTAMSDLK